MNQRRQSRRSWTILIAALGAVGLSAVTAVTAAGPAQAATACAVTYRVTSEWSGGFGATVDLRNLGDPVSNWTLSWTFPSGQTVTSGWNGTFTQSGSTVSVAAAAWNASLGTGATAGIGFNGAQNGANAVPTSFRMNGVTCSGSTGPSTPPTTPPNTPGPTTAPPTPRPTTPPPGPSVPPQTGLVGWATQNGGTSGGSASTVVNVSTASAFLTAIRSTTSQTVRLTGNISLSGMNAVASNKTIIGAGAGATISGGGLNLSGVRNVIVRNLNFTGWNDDAINVQESTNVWIDHNSFSNGFDGTVDIKRGSDFVTVSWNRTFNHNKAMLLGHSDGNAAQDVGRLRVTYHHNWFDATRQRHPRVRFGDPVHVYNNYYNRIGSYGVASTMNAGVLVEGNYFEGVADPFHRGEGSSADGNLVARNNFFTGSGSGEAGGSVKPIPYSYTLDAAANVKSIVTAGAGVGRLNL